MNNSQTPAVSAFLPTALTLVIIGWGGLIALIFLAPPTIGPRWLFFFLAVLAVTGFFLPLVAFLHQRFPSNPPVNTGVVLRQAIWIGIYFPTLAWLQLGRVLNPALAILLAVGLILIEFLLRLREKSLWNP